ncbi:NACHT domain-containing protein [Streptoalloteichus tenebrarius]|uniref:NACHT domain-containing protein n=1 Tax=Streptoalloteichus tenebrarius (strain ATCC 17920 / DSM 40477 / JCM 4838 / CBS 697.72 / NBRC 16177 / NCIMB 11028 / NRRL B-12390 / A12253. 1 / ISP 5477) TaxID=1933 RepID=A0ABT1HM18_STRSD|nr:NACHT domain-containing protein [Streptoalloteichus tenebrarius]MCP2256572.1 NACHT domain-containing protein [Streptoalloteichus tenebrarius]
MASGLEAPVARVLVQVGQKLLGTVRGRRARSRLREDTRALVSTRVAEGFLAELDPEEIHRLGEYLLSPDFEEIALQFTLGRLLNDVPWEGLKVNIRYELRQGLHNVVKLRPELLVTAADVLFDSLTTAANETVDQTVRHHLDPTTAAAAGHLVAAAAANSRLLREIGDLSEIHTFAAQLRDLVAAVHGHMRLPHLGVSRSVPYEQLYVEPTLCPEQEHQDVPDLMALALPGRRSVILGDPGAGKSTLASKLAHDVACDRVAGAEGRVPFLLVLRNFTSSFREGGKGLAHYLERICGDPYNLEPPSHAVDYLLRNGRAVVVLDGLDELVEPELRRKVVQLVEGFVSRYPLVPVLVTARRIGYSDAPLDPRLFRVGVVSKMGDDQVRQYVERWFALDESTAESDRARMADSFLKESKGIADLRSNPLLLALLCAMYSSEYYIPHNLAQIYERCAIMLFDRWDSMRGISPPMQFHGRLRAAVQYLAWELFRAEESGKALPRHAIVRILARHLMAKKFDEDDALAAAEQFVEFCTGRAWILTDVGATDVEPCYGFTHRTFMEYFAAEHLVRTHPTPERLWEALRPRILAGEWDVVAQIALQLLDRNIDGGVDDLLRLALAEAGGDSEQPGRLLGFAARALGYVHPGHDVIHDVVEAALEAALEGDVSDRFHYWVGSSTFMRMEALNGALYSVMYRCSPGNLPVLKRLVTAILAGHVESGSGLALHFIVHMSTRYPDVDDRICRAWREVHGELTRRYVEEVEQWAERGPWKSIHAGSGLVRLVAEFGPGPLYLCDTFLVFSYSSQAERLLRTGFAAGRHAPEPAPFCDALIEAGRPWISDERWWTDFTADSLRGRSGIAYTIEEAPWSQAPLAPMMLLLLPYLESIAHGYFPLVLPDSVPLVHQLTAARAVGAVHSDLTRALENADMPEKVKDFLLSWVRGEFDVLGPPPPGWDRSKIYGDDL